MPQITTIRVVRKRSVQPEQFGNATAEVELVGNVLEGEDYKEVARQMLIDSRALVYDNLGMKLPASAVANAAEVDTPTETAKAETAKAPATKKRGRPTKAEQAAKKAAEEAATEAATADDTDGIPGDDDDAPQISTNPEDRKNPEDEIPGDETETEEEDGEEFSAQDLHNFINDSIKAGKLTVPQAKQMQKEMKVARVRDLDTPEKIAKAKNMIDKAIEANEVK